MPSLQHATIVPLEFEDRPEYSVVFLSFDWEDLGPLLANPIAYLSANGVAWGQKFPNGMPRINWELFSPVTVVLEWIGNNVDGFLKSFDLATLKFGGSLPKAARKAMAGGSKGITLDVNFLESLKGTFKLQQLSLGLLEAAFPDGVLWAEFAVTTHTLTIYYHPKKRGATRFDGVLPLAATMVTLTPRNALGTQRASFHFDIGQDEVERAAFIVDYIEDFDNCLHTSLRVCPTSTTSEKDADAAAQHAPSPKPKQVGEGDPTAIPHPAKFYKGEAKFVEKGKKIIVEDPLPATMPAFRRLPDSFYPTIIIDSSPSMRPEHRSEADNRCQICILINGVYQPDPNVFYPGTTIVKCYVPPPTLV